MRETFGKDEKLKSSRLITQLFNEGKAVTVFPIKLIYLPVEHQSEQLIQAAVSVPKRRFKSAVKRNRIKRLLREVYRKNKTMVYQTEHTKKHIFMFIYLGTEEPKYHTLERQMQNILQKFLEKANGLT